MEEQKFIFELKRHWWIPTIVLVLLIVLAVLLGILIAGGKKSSSYVAPAAGVELSTETARSQGSTDFEWCVMLNLSDGMHLPHLKMNVMRDAIISNGQSGYNWDMVPGKHTIADDAALLSDTTYVIKKHVLAEFNPQQIHIKPKEMGYIPQPMIEVRLSNGEEAFIWNRNPKTLGKYKQ